MRRLGTVFVSLSLGCAGAPASPAAPVAEASTAPVLAPAPVAAAPAPVVTAPADPVSAAPVDSASAAASTSAVVVPAVDAACRGASFDMARVPKVCVVTTQELSATPGAFAAHLVVSTDKVKAGKSLNVVAELTNTSNAPAVLTFKPECSGPQPQVFRDGKRADLVDACDTLSGCMDKTMQLVLEPGGRLTARASMKTVVTKHRRSDCTSYVAGPLAAGEYELRVHAPLFPVAALGEATAKLTVTK